MNEFKDVLELHDLDQTMSFLRDPARAGKLKRMGYVLSRLSGLERERERLTGLLDRRWLSLYERSLGRYGHGITRVRGRVCQGCFLTLPTSAAPSPGDAQLHLCENCGRLLYWR